MASQENMSNVSEHHNMMIITSRLLLTVDTIWRAIFFLNNYFKIEWSSSAYNEGNFYHDKQLKILLAALPTSYNMSLVWILNFFFGLWRTKRSKTSSKVSTYGSFEKLKIKDERKMSFFLHDGVKVFVVDWW